MYRGDKLSFRVVAGCQRQLCDNIQSTTPHSHYYSRCDLCWQIFDIQGKILYALHAVVLRYLFHKARD